MRYLILLVTLCVISAASLAQTLPRYPQVEERIAEIKKRELADPKKAKFWRKGDSYERLVRMHILHDIGLFKATPSAKSDETEILFAEKDTVVNASNTTTSQDETTISINRKNKKIIVASANDAGMYTGGMPIYRTSNGGKNWTKPSGSARRVASPQDYIPLGDPIITCSNDGYFYFSYLTTNITSSFANTTNITVAKSLDGLTWEHCGNVVPIEDEINFEDKEVICVDNSPGSQWKGRLYVIWNRFDMDSFEPMMALASSDDQGATWKITPDIVEGSSFPIVRIGLNGEVYAGTSVAETHSVVLSTDGGSTFKEIFSMDFNDLPSNVEGRPSLKGEFGPRIYPFVSFDIDKAGGIHLVYGTWSGEASQIHYTYTADKGKNWSTSQIVGIANPASNDEEKDRFFPWVTVDQITGEAYVLYYTSEHDPDNIMTTVMRQKLTPVLTEHPLPVAKTPFDPTVVDISQSGTSFIGDYIGSDAHDSVYAACWMGLQGSRKDGDVFVFVSNPLPQDSVTVSVGPTVVDGSVPVISWISPNPAKADRVSVSYFSPTTTSITAELFTIDGKLLVSLYSGIADEGTSTLDLHLPAVANGSYFLKVTSQAGSAQRQIVIAR